MAMAVSTSGKANPSFAPDSSDSSCRSRAGKSRSASSPVTTLEASTGSVGHRAAPSKAAAAMGIERNNQLSPVVTTAITGIATRRSRVTGRQQRRTSAIG